jgi:phage terminase large subunit
MVGELEFSVSAVFEKNYEALTELDYSGERRWKFILNEGGTRSGKTHSILQCLIHQAITRPKITIVIVKRTKTSMYEMVIKEFMNILKDLDLYSDRNYNKVKSVYIFPNGSQVSFIGGDDGDSLRGFASDMIFFNEANLIKKDVYLQLAMRTSGQIFCDLNPSENDHWVYDLQKEENAITIKSTYLDNDFLSAGQVKFIEDLIRTDENYYRVYALGLQPIPKSRVYNHFIEWDTLNENIEHKIVDYSYGLDFGFNHITALVKVMRTNDAYYIKEEIYLPELTPTDLVNKMKEVGIEKNKYIWADSARPDIIEEIRRAGYFIRGVNKGGSGGSVKAGIDKIRTSVIYLDKYSNNIWSEYNKYMWKTYNDNILQEPVKLYDDAMDAIRYAIWSDGNGGGGSKFRFSVR